MGQTGLFVPAGISWQEWPRADGAESPREARLGLSLAFQAPFLALAHPGDNPQPTAASLGKTTAERCATELGAGVEMGLEAAR